MSVKDTVRRVGTDPTQGLGIAQGCFQQQWDKMATKFWAPHQRSVRSIKGRIGFKFQVALKNWILLNYCKFFIHLYGFGSERKLQHNNQMHLKMETKSKRSLAGWQTKQFQFKQSNV